MRCTWSPCQKCLREQPASFLKNRSVAGRGIRLKFRYTNIYSKTSWPYNAPQVSQKYLLWEDDQAALNAYAQAMSEYGNQTVFKTRKLMEYLPAVTQTTEKIISNLVIQPITMARTSKTVDVYEF